MYPNDIRFAEDVVNQFADYADQGLTGFVPWAYPNEKSAPKNFGCALLRLARVARLPPTTRRFTSRLAP